MTPNMRPPLARLGGIPARVSSEDPNVSPGNRYRLLTDR
jgi:hypothetical protein